MGLDFERNFTTKRMVDNIVNFDGLTSNNNNRNNYMVSIDNNNPEKLGVFFMDIYFALNKKDINVDNKFFDKISDRTNLELQMQDIAYELFKVAYGDNEFLIKNMVIKLIEINK